jgi:HEAT repeat protein
MRLFTFAVAVAIASALTSPLLGQKNAAGLDLKGKSLKQAFADLLPGLAAGKNDAQQKWQEICFRLGAPGQEAQRREACQLMAEHLDAGTANVARIWLLKQLERIGRDECVAAVAACLDDKDDLVRDAAVRCLANNPSPAATGQLLARLPGSSGKAKVGLLNALGHRADPAAVEAVARELADKDTSVAIAAARTLGRIGTPSAARALAEARPGTADALRLAIGDAYLRCADRLLAAGKTAEALAIYKELNQPKEERPLRLAALQGVLRCAGDQAGPMILDILSGPDADARAIAIGQIEYLSPGALKPLAARLEQLPPASQVLVLNMIASRSDRSQLPAALAAVQSPHDGVKRAGIQALGRLGDISVVPLLVETLFAGGSLGQAAADSLAQLAADGVNDRLIALLEAEKTAARAAALIGVLEARKATAAVPALLKSADSKDPAIQAAAWTALRSLAEPRHLPELVAALLQTEKGREQAELAIVAVCAQIPEPEKRARPILAVVKAGDRNQLAALLPLLGRLGGPEVLPLAREALTSGNPELHQAAFTALCHWPDPAVNPDLLQLAQSAQQPEQRLRALQAVIRINTTQPSDRRNDERLASLAALRKAMELASRNDERRAILEGIGFVRTLETFRYVLPYLDDKELNQSACKAVVELAHSRTLREPNQAEFNKALDRVIAICKDKLLVDRARQYRQ